MLLWDLLCQSALKEWSTFKLKLKLSSDWGNCNYLVHKNVFERNSRHLKLRNICNFHISSFCVLCWSSYKQLEKLVMGMRTIYAHLFLPSIESSNLIDNQQNVKYCRTTLPFFSSVNCPQKSRMKNCSSANWLLKFILQWMSYQKKRIFFWRFAWYFCWGKTLWRFCVNFFHCSLKSAK